MDKVFLNNPYDTAHPTEAHVLGTYTTTTSVPGNGPQAEPVTTDVDVYVCIVPDHAVVAPDGTATIGWRLVTDDQFVNEDGTPVNADAPETGNGDGAWENGGTT